MPLLPSHITSGDPKLQRLLNQMIDYMKSLSPRSFVNGRFEWTANGVSYVAGGGGFSGGQDVLRCIVQSETDLYLNCQEYADGNIPTGPVFKVLKPLELQNWIWQQNQYGLEFKFTPLVIAGVISPNKRYCQVLQTGLEKNVLAGDQILIQYKEVMFPGYQSTDLVNTFSTNTIWAVKLLPRQVASDGIKWMDLNIDARAWHKEIPICTPSGIVNILLRASTPYNGTIDFTTV